MRGAAGSMKTEYKRGCGLVGGGGGGIRLTWQVDGWHKISESFNSVSHLEDPKYPCTKEAKV